MLIDTFFFGVRPRVSLVLIGARDDHTTACIDRTIAAVVVVRGEETFLMVEKINALAKNSPPT